ncbi:MAG TPA: hypothetical protein VJ461_06710 [Candidatus Nanoarchaeia archaeon]|nr:hypothetical protein [Candidatus Nanoarchaeia archaeon]
MNKRGAYFFVIDAMIASTIIIMSLIIIFSSHTTRTESNPTVRMLGEYLSFISTTKVRNFQGSYVQNLTNDGNITNRDNTLLGQLTEFYYYNQTGFKNTSIIMANFLQEINKGAIPDYRSLAFYINDTLIYQSQFITPDEAGLGLNMKKISFKRINDTYIYGPVIVEVRVWV